MALRNSSAPGLLLLLLTAQTAVADNISLQPTDDIGARNIGDRSTLSISKWDHGFFRFALDGVSAPIEQATLRLYSYSSDDLETLVWRAGSDDWDESTGRPANAGYAWITSPLGVATHNSAGYLDIDVTAFVQEQASDDDIASFEVSSSSGGWRTYSSRESEFAPRLLITTSANGSTENLAPTAVINASAESGTAPLEISFDASASSDQDGTINDYQWLFGTGASSDALSPVYTFAEPGEFTVQLTVTDNQGLSHSQTRLINVTAPSANEPPVARFETSPSNPVQDAAVQFDASSSSDAESSALSYSWDLGDGTQKTGVTISHAYANAGNYTVTLTVTDPEDASHSTSGSVSVSPNNATPADTLTLSPSADIGASNVGTASPLRLSYWDRGFFKFALPAELTDISAATFRLYHLESVELATQVRLATSDDWTETGSRPAKSNSIAVCNVSNGGQPGYVDCDVTELVQIEAAGDRIISLEVGSDNGGWKRFGSREGQYKPELVIQTAASPAPENQLPSAAFTATPTSGTAPLTVQLNAGASTDADGELQSYQWVFGDGTTGSGVQTSHVYEEDGNYSITLTVSDDQGAIATHVETVTVSPLVVEPVNQLPQAAFSASDTSGFAPLEVNFNRLLSTDPDGEISSYQWSFGDGASADTASASHTFTGSGEFTVTLTVTDNDGDSHSASQVISVLDPVVNEPPTALFGISKNPANVNEAIAFNAELSSDDTQIKTYEWIFGDGNNGSGLSISHSYAAPGDYTVSLTVTDNDGVSSNVSQTVSVTEPSSTSPVTSTLLPSDDIGASNNGSTTDLRLSYWDHAYLRFPLDGISGQVESATFRLYYTRTEAPETIVWAADSDQWSEDSGAPTRIGFASSNQPLCTMTGTITPGYLECDISDFVQ